VAGRSGSGARREKQAPDGQPTLSNGLKLDVAYPFCASCIAIANTICYNLSRQMEKKTMTKTANLYARIEPELKNEAESILSGLGVPVSNAINMFYRQIVIHRGLPFAVQYPSRSLMNAATLTDAKLDAEVARGFDDIAAGRKRSLAQARADLAQEFGL
jgi:DNA-damage-inducible protein J